ncbi:MAG: hypothetical protein GY820_08325 [Gammaproteobacteria bacterium]|nr:hypothetical protein [Gammaproteobacteria bacterium]
MVNATGNGLPRIYRAKVIVVGERFIFLVEMLRTLLKRYSGEYSVGKSALTKVLEANAVSAFPASYTMV